MREVRLIVSCRAQYPLQWLGERLIQQSILFEGNPDSTSIKERFLYNHESAAKPSQLGGKEQAQRATSVTPSQPAADSTPGEAQPEALPMTDAGHTTAHDVNENQISAQGAAIEVSAAEIKSEHPPSINGTMQVEQPEQAEMTERTEPPLPAEDSEMTNAP